MKLANTKLKKTLLILGSILIIVPIIIIIFISPITKYMVEKYSVKYTGRQIKMKWAYVNPFTGYVHFSNFTVFEAQNDSTFFSADGVSANFSLPKMLSGTYEISSLTLDKPKGIIILNARNDFNFSDLIEKFKPDSISTGPPLHFNILNVKINDGLFYFHDTLIHIHYFIKDVNFESTGKWWNVDTIVGKISFAAGIGTGDMKANFSINLKTSNYTYSLLVHNYNMAIIDQYMKDIVNYGTFSASLEADLKAKGNLKDEDDLDTKGRIVVNNFHFGKSPGNDYLSFDKFSLVIDEVNPEHHLYHLDSLTLVHPYFKYEEYDRLNNIETMFGEKGGNVTAVNNDKNRFNLVIELVHYLTNVSKNFFQSAYKINTLAISRADILFNDYSSSEKFSLQASPLYITADSINKKHGKVNFSIKSDIKPYGKMSVYATINPRDSADFTVSYHLTGVPVSVFNPYTISYTSFPFDCGTINLNGDWNVKNGYIQSENHLLIIDPQLAERLKNNDTKWVPMRLVMALARNRSNVIDYSIPVSGNLKNPLFNLTNVIVTALKNIFVKPPTAPYGLKVKNQEKEIEQSLTLKWEMRQSKMLPKQERFMKKLAKFLKDNPDASIVISPQQYEKKEKEYILFFEAKKKYYLYCHPQKSPVLSESDSEKVTKMSVKDSLFISYLNKHQSSGLVFTVQDKCLNLVGLTLLNNRFKQLNKDRKDAFISCFNGMGVDNKITFTAAENTIPYNGFSFYKIKYKGELPGYLLRAYKEIAALDDESPREKYKEDREKIKTD